MENSKLTKCIATSNNQAVVRKGMSLGWEIELKFIFSYLLNKKWQHLICCHIKLLVNN